MTAVFQKLDQLEYSGSEAINTLSTNLSFAGRNTKIIMMTSCQASEGKTFVSVNLARNLAQLGKSVVLVDADLRKSIMNARFNIKLPAGAMGLAHYLAGMCSQEAILYDTNIQNAFFIPVGRTVSNSLALLSTPLLGKLLKLLSTNVDYVIVDAPPIGAIIDPAEIAKSCDGALIVVTYNKIRRRDLINAKQQIEMTGCPVLGTVLNNVDMSTLSSKKYYATKYYSSYLEEGNRSLPRNSARAKGKR